MVRLKKGYQVKQLAKILGFSEAIISLWEKGKAHPKHFYMVRTLKKTLPELSKLPPSIFYPYFPEKPSNLAEIVKRDRLLLDLSQNEYAKHLGVGIHTIVDRERGRIKSNTTKSGIVLQK